MDNNKEILRYTGASDEELNIGQLEQSILQLS